jgi:hypothetical protein
MGNKRMGNKTRKSMVQPLKDRDDRMRCLEIEFVGGPYDGHKVMRRTRPERLPKDLVWLVGEDTFRLIGEVNRPSRRSNRSLTSVALYSLEEADREYRYRFVGAVSIDKLMDSI